MKKLTAFLMLCGLIALAGCNTMKGAGQDIQKGGEKLENAANKHS
ncbi:Predicted small secreted protein [Methylobacillus rhizosphaerae]|uniref:Predicted small secreted protein n=1 Tax=Methylobacillus rhizosphaerae TaxID=551994 RepID=A0A238Z939_9PROT|nr:entericidin A/B family lipoprotein [Methylobacillus rhizosphaerae]SNR79204.1 Predicted small secreted protein [Methylobacillus rhizosphaerae]